MKTFYSIATVFFFIQTIIAQQLFMKKQDSLFRISSQTQIAVAASVNGMNDISMKSENEQKRFIIELNEQPNVIQKLNTFGTKASTLSAKRTAFRSKLAEATSSAKIVAEFSEVISGFCIVGSQSDVEKIAKLSDVKQIYEDIKVSANPITSTSSEIYPEGMISNIAKGNGIRVGIIDTGIDYLHEALGGGFGVGFKVAGGYDFINEDSDPQDDNGHGTHVAGIIAGSSATFSGMAPNAQLYSYKALDASGSGYVSTVIAAIEQAIKDNVHVLNLSLGSPSGSPDDILSQAVDRAVQAGIVVVVAAGNFSDAGTIGSPGAAKLALTVGAIDASNKIASFSSKGPVIKSFGLKPDVVAPGVSIISAKLGSGYIGMSGTSMATPHVAGLAAALRELHPDWSALQIRNSIIESSERLAYPLFSVGSGKIQPERASRLGTIVSPNALNFGFDASEFDVWKRKDTLRIKNVSSQNQIYTIQANNTIPAVSFNFSENSFSLKTNEEKNIIVESSVYNSVLPDNKSITEGYLGSLSVLSTFDTITIPYGFFKGNILHISFDETPWQVIVHNGKGITKSFVPKTNVISVVLTNDTYDIITNFYRSHYVVKESITVRGNTSIAINKSDAIHKVTLFPVDEAGNAISASPKLLYSSVEGIFHKQSGTYVLTMSGAPYEKPELELNKYISSVSNKYTFGYSINILEGNTKTFSFQMSLDSGIANNQTITFDVSSMKKINVKYDVDSTITHKLFPITWTGITDNTGWLGVTFYDENAQPLIYPFVQTAIYVGNQTTKFPFYHIREGYKY